MLWSPGSFKAASQRERRAVIGRGGCGAGDGLGDRLVPDTMWGLSVQPACEIHDWMYAKGRSIEDKKQADGVFLDNLLRIIDAGTSSWVLRKLRRRRARTYYLSVKYFGGPAFWGDTASGMESREE